MRTKLSILLPLGLCLLAQGIQPAHAGTVIYVYTDPQGTPLAEADATGAITTSFDYRPYGSLTLGAPTAGPGYTGHVNDPDTGLLYMQARYYDPVTARFLSVDSVRPEGGKPFGFNRYAYANGNPYKYTDPDGRFAQLVWGAIAGAAVEVFIETAIQGKSFSEINYKNVAIAAGTGAITAGVGSAAALAAARGAITVTRAVATTAAAGAATGSAGSVVQDLANGEQPSVTKTVAAGALGAVGAGAGARLSLAPLATLENMGSKGLPSVATHIADTTRSAIVGPATAVVTASTSKSGSSVGNAIGAELSVLNDKINDKIDGK